MKKFLAIVVLGLLFSGNAYTEEKKLEAVTDPKIIEELDKLFEEEHKKRFEKSYFDGFIKCTKNSFFSKNDPIYFGIPIKHRLEEIHSGWDNYKHDFQKWHRMEDHSIKYYFFYKEPGSTIRKSFNRDLLYKIDRETGDMFELNKKINSEKKIRNCEKISYDDLPMLKPKVKF